MPPMQLWGPVPIQVQTSEKTQLSFMEMFWDIQQQGSPHIKSKRESGCHHFLQKKGERFPFPKNLNCREPQTPQISLSSVLNHCAFLILSPSAVLVKEPHGGSVSDNRFFMASSLWHRMNQTQLKLPIKRAGLRVTHIPLLLGDASFFLHCMNEQTLLMTDFYSWVVLSH